MSLWNKLFGKKEEPASPQKPAPTSPPKKAEPPLSAPAQPPVKDAPLTSKTLSYRKRTIATGPAPFGRQSGLVSPAAGVPKPETGVDTPSTPTPTSPVGTSHAPASPVKPAPPTFRTVATPPIDPTDPYSRREIRVFISSTFRDMQEERELLVKKVFPELRRICDERFVSFTEVDLRWGITEEEAAEGKVLPICLEEIHTCRPYFIGILGERYGWIPDTVPQEVLEKEPWIQEHIGHRTSVTELEILHGVLRNPKMDDHAFFYFRDPAYVANRGEDFQTENPDSAAKLAALKEIIRHSGRPLVDPYKKPEYLAAAVKQQFFKLIDQLYPKEQVPDPLDQEAIGHRSYSRRKLLAYVDRPSHSQALASFVAAPTTGQGLVVTGDSGGGKTALLAAFASAIIQQQSYFLFEHYFGGTPDSASVDGFLRRLLGELKRLADIKEEMPTTPEKMREALPLWLVQTAGGKSIVLVLDALNQIQGDEADRHLNWLPRFFPAHIRVVVSSLSGSVLDALRERGWAEHLLPLADTAERGQMIHAFLKVLYNKELSTPLRDRIVNASGTANPLFLRTVLEELRQFGSFEKLPDQVDAYLKATTPQDLFRQVIRRWQDDFHAGRDIVVRSLRHLWAARQGLSESEWLDLLADQQGEMDRQTWRPLLLAMEPHLGQRGSLWAFGHDFLKQAIGLELLPSEPEQQKAHLTLADYYEAQPITPRSTIELPHQLQYANSKDRLRACLLDIDRFLLMQKRDENELMHYWVWLHEERAMGPLYVNTFNYWAADKGESATISLTANRLALFLSFRAALHAEAEPLYRRALAIDEGSYGESHSKVAIILSNLGQLLSEINRLSEAEPLMRRALAIDEATYGNNHPAVAIRLNNLGQLLSAANRLSEAEPLMRRALANNETSYGENHSSVASCLNNLALLLQATNRRVEAEELMRRALKIGEASYGKDHPFVALRLHNLAAFLDAAKSHAEAETMYRRSLAINEASYGKNHPSVAKDLNNLAALLAATNHHEEAEAMYRRSLTINEACYGKNHPYFATELNNLAGLLCATNRTLEAIPLIERCLKINEVSLGPDHPHTAASLASLAGALQAANRLAEAEPLMRRALGIDEASYGPDNPEVATDLTNLAQLLNDTNRAGEAEPLMRRALTIDEASFGGKHPRVARDLGNLALLLNDTNRLAEAEPLMRRALVIDEESYGPAHPNVARDLGSLAGLLLATNRLAEAEPLMRRALDVNEQSVGPDHPNVAKSLNNLAQLFRMTNRTQDAIALIERGLKINETSLGCDNPNTAVSLAWLADAFQATNRLAEAESLIRRALVIWEQSRGMHHPNVARNLNNLAQLLKVTNRLVEAEPLMRRALAIDERNNGTNHPSVAIRLNNLAQLLKTANRMGEAEPLMRRMVEIFLEFTRTTAHAHPHLRGACGNYGRLLEAMGRSAKEISQTLAELGRRYGVDLTLD